MTWFPYRYHPEHCGAPTEEEEYLINHKTHQVKKKGEGECTITLAINGGLGSGIPNRSMHGEHAWKEEEEGRNGERWWGYVISEQ